ncbi:hypothetical protein Ocin01_00377 [Orchesella cincta]|uniref:Uncharacterized protein n=1 Tax=Orchesella cincta TaxID=48709 RepID=A0A1D2NM30_ORCCI|nr:hypothetical protein Ocin01_00377 [Orchesella cincta]
MKHFIILFALVAAAYAGVAYHGGILTSTGYQAPSLHAPWASSVDTGIRRFGSTAGYIAAPAYYATAAIAAPAYGHHYY